MAREATRLGHLRLSALLFLVSLLVGACAGTAASVRPMTGEQKGPELAAYRRLALQVTKTDGLEVGDQDLDRIAQRIMEALRKSQPERFEKIDGGTPAQAEPGTLGARVQLTKYDKGSAAARFMLAGLGQIRINATVALHDLAENRSLGEYEVTKTFAWGGIYGGATTIEDVELGFAEGVAAILLDRRQ